MPTIEFNKDDLLDLVDEDMDDETLEERLTRVKVEVEEIEDDKVGVEVTSDRIDLLSVEGIARNLRAHLGKTPGLPDYTIHQDNYTFTVEDVPVRPHVATAVVKGVNLSTAALKSLIQLQEKLHGTFGRDRDRVSIGIHNMAEISFPLRYHAEKPDSYRFVPLGHEEDMTLGEILEEHEKGREYAHIIEEADTWPLITDSDDNVLSFPPIINGVLTEVTADSTDLFIDVTGTDEEAIRYALNVIVTALVERGGDIYSVTMKRGGETVQSPDLSAQAKDVELSYLSQVTGVELDEETAKTYFEKMMYGFSVDDDTCTVSIPPFRADILHQVDLAEDIAIGFGYNNIEPQLPNLSTIGSHDRLEKFMHDIRELMVGHGYQEVMNPSLTDEETLLTHMERGDDAANTIVDLANPVSEHYTRVRDLLTPQLLDTLARNTHNTYPQRIFEAADTVVKDASKNVKARTDKHLAAVTAENRITYNELRGQLEGVLEALEISYSFRQTCEPFLIEGRAAALVVNGNEIGFVGEVAPQVLEKHGLETPVAGFEINLSALFNASKAARQK